MKLFLIAALAFGLTVAGAAWSGVPSTAQKDCCTEGAACCNPPQDCCLTSAKAQPTSAAADCCARGLDCCNQAAECCRAPSAGDRGK